MSEVAEKDILDLCNNPNPKLKEQRIHANRLLLEQLALMINEFPDLRFSQILSNFGFVKQYVSDMNGANANYSWVDEYYLEPNELLKRVTESIQKVYNV